jgi:hypothetical protein
VKRQLTKDEADSFRLRLQAWQSPNSFKLVLGELIEITGSDYLLLGDTDFREAHIAEWCANAQSPDQVRLYPNEQGDFEFDTGGVLRRFETTEAILSDRRRNAEIRDELRQPSGKTPGFTFVSQERLNWEDADAERQVIARAEAKAGKSYDFGITELVVYKNCGWGGHQHDSFIESAFEKMPNACARFRRVWIYSSGDGLIPISDAGRKASTEWMENRRREHEEAHAMSASALEELLAEN